MNQTTERYLVKATTRNGDILTYHNLSMKAQRPECDAMFIDWPFLSSDEQQAAQASISVLFDAQGLEELKRYLEQAEHVATATIVEIDFPIYWNEHNAQTMEADALAAAEVGITEDFAAQAQEPPGELLATESGQIFGVISASGQKPFTLKFV